MSRVLITGAAAGLGRALVEHHQALGDEVVGVDLHAAGLPFPCEACDLAEASQVAALLERLAAPAFDVVIHNAGLNESGRFERQAPEDQARMIAVNLTAPMLLTAGLLQRRLVAAGGTVVFVSSLSHYVGYPGASVYAATKDGLTNYARSLFVLLGPRDINVLSVFPGPVRTEQARRASPPGSDDGGRMRPEELAARIGRAITKRKRVLVPGWRNKLLGFLGRQLPMVTERGMRKAIYDKFPS